jgi:hypothetical protein
MMRMEASLQSSEVSLPGESAADHVLTAGLSLGISQSRLLRADEVIQ